MANIHVVEDDKTHLALYRDLLAEQGHRVTCFQRGEDLIDAMNENRPQLIILDVSLPGMAGTDACRKIRATPGGAPIPVVIVSAYDKEPEIDEGFRCGADEYLTKPIRASELVTKVNMLLDSGFVSSQYPPLVKSNFKGKFILEDLLGRNSDASVYLARGLSVRHGQNLALKIYKGMVRDERLRSEFLYRVCRVSELNHPNIAKAYDYGLEKERFYVARDFVEGSSLQDIIRRDKLTETIAVIVAKETVRAIKEFMRLGIKAINIKPGNIIIGDDGSVVLVDYCRPLATEMVKTKSATEENGKPRRLFLSPRRALGKLDGGVEEELFSLALTLYYALSGSLPMFVHHHHHQNQDPPEKPAALKQLAPEVSEAFSELIDRTIEPDPKKRCPLKEFEDRLRRLDQGGLDFA